LECLPVEGESWVVPPKEEDDVIWRDREDLRDLLICSIDPPGMLPYFWSGVKLMVQDVQISMMLFMLDHCQTGTSKLVSVSRPPSHSSERKANE
jgi:hypothetical protein